MFDEFLQRRREKKAIREWKGSGVGRTLQEHIDRYLGYPRFKNMEVDGRAKFVSDLYDEVFKILRSENPFQAMREGIASYVSGLTELQVLSLTEEEKAVGLYADCPYISGELHPHILQAADGIEELRELKWRHTGLVPEELMEYCNARGFYYTFHLNGLNCLRQELDDFNETKDWLRPFLKSMLIWNEDVVRGRLGLPSLLPNKFDGTRHSTFFKFVAEGHRSPYYEWEKSWSDDNGN